jgi:hypothetical protein
MRRLVLLLLAALVGSTAAPAAAVPPEKFPVEPSQFTIEGICDFDVDVTDVRVHANSLVFFGREGEVKKVILAGNFVTRYTNASTGTSITVNISGQFFQTPNPDGSLTLLAHGRNILFTVEPEPFMVFRSGRVVATLTFSEEVGLEIVINEVSGRGFDVCEALAG